jgi:glycosyltransferase involved in cell wall biosynthesis
MGRTCQMMIPGAPVTVVVLTHNEEINIGRCLRSVQGWAAEIFVVDSLSTDRTAEIARRLGAQVVPHAFTGFADQRNWALDHLPVTQEWLLFLDADEWVPAPLRVEIAEHLAAGGGRVDGYCIPRLHRFLGRWLRHGGLYPTYQLRLFRRGRARCEQRLVDEHFIVDGPTATLRSDLLTEDRKGIGPWIDRHNRYAALEAREMAGEGFASGRLSGRLGGSQAERKRWIRHRLWNRLPLYTRPFVLFVYRYVLRGGFLDGRAGLVYHLLESFWYRLLIDLHFAERRAGGRRPARAEGSMAEEQAEVRT